MSLEPSKTITVATIDDSAVESAETMTVTLSSPSANSTITTATGTGTINDNDTMIVLTDIFLNVLPQHSSTYSCYMGQFYEWGGYYEFCQNSSNVIVYDAYAAPYPALDPGYSMPVQKQLEVAPPYYGTGVSP